MRLPLVCVECAMSGSVGDPVELVFVDLEGEHLFRITCSRRHATLLGLRQPRFKILYESGAQALLDGYYREAVVSIASSVERFYEYWIRVTLMHLGMPIEAIKKTWSLVARRSERQSGAFLLLYLRERGRVPPNLDDREEFRNGVVHRGDFPSWAEAVAYAERVLNWVAPLYRELQELAPSGVQAFMEAQEAEIKKTGANSLAIVTIVGRATDMLPKLPALEEELQLLDGRRRGRGGGMQFFTSASPARF